MKKLLLSALVILPMITMAQLTQNFDTFPPAGWTTVNSHPTKNWSGRAAGITGPDARCQWNDDGTGTADGIVQNEDLISPVFTVPAGTPTLSFSASLSYNWMVTNNNCDLKVSISTNGGTSWTQVWQESDQGVFANYTTFVVSIPLTTYAGQTNCKIKFNYSGNDGADAYIDNIKVEGCSTPVLTAGTFTDTSAIVNFATSGNYQVEYGVFPYVQGGSGGMTATVTAGTTTTLSGLTSGVSYSVYARRDCGSGNFSAWSAVRVVGTSNTAPASVPYATGFEPAANQSFLFNLGWGNQATGNVGTWQWFADGTTAPFYADAGIYHLGSAIFTDAAMNAYMFSRPIAMTGGQLYQITYKYRTFSAAATTPPITTVPMAFRVVTNTTNTATGVNVLTTKTGVNNLTYISETLDFTPATTGNYYIGFHNNTPAATTATTNNFIFIDTFNVASSLSNDKFDATSVSLFPNPATDILNVTGVDGITSLVINDINGRTIKTVNNASSINVSDLNTGVYFINIATENGNITKKFMKN
jgi:Secretion system C-terminal sorting domain